MNIIKWVQSSVTQSLTKVQKQ